MQEKTKKKGNPVSYLFRKMWQYSENKKSIVLYWCMFVIANAIFLFLQPLVWAKIMNVIQKQGINADNIQHLVRLLVFTLAIEVSFWLFHGPGRIIEQVNAFKTRVNYRKFLLRGVMTQPLEWHTEYHSGDTIDKIEKGTSALYDFSEESFEIIGAIAQLIISFGMLAYYCRSVSLIALAMILLAVWTTIRFDRVLIGQYAELSKIDNNISASVFDAISNISTIIILRTERLIFKAIIEKVLKPFGLFRKNIIINETKWCLISLLCTLMTAIVLCAYFYREVSSHKAILIGTVFLVIKYLDKIGELFFRFAYVYSRIVRRKARVMNSEELTLGFKTENFSNHVLPENWKRLEISELDFSYESNACTEPNLDNVSLSIDKGERIALVGETGSGKTTLLKVIRDLYHPQCLKLRVDGCEITDGFGGIARAITLVPQNPEILATTIFGNITLGADHNIDNVRHFTDIACFTEVVEKLPKKFESSIKEKGVNLSGGEQQRLALSRGLVACQDKEIILLDEPTSSIDAWNEKRIYQNIFEEFKGKTIISSIHRLHLLTLFDKIYVFDKGRIIGAGTFNELLNSCDKFLELWQQVSDI